MEFTVIIYGTGQRLPCAKGGGAERRRDCQPLSLAVARQLPLHREALFCRIRELFLCRGVRQGAALRYNCVNFLADTAKISADLVVRNSKHPQTVCSQKCGAFGISFRIAVLIVLRPVQLNDQLCARTVKIDDITTKNLLPCKSNGIGAKKVIPQAALLLGHILPKLSGKRDQTRIVL